MTMVEFLPDTEESRRIIANSANCYAKRTIEDPSWLDKLTPEETSNAKLMMFAHADEELSEKAIKRLIAHEDGLDGPNRVE